VDKSLAANVTLSKSSGPNLCPPSLPITFTHAPVLDISMNGSPAVFVQ
jgi:hypothetical protein